MPAYRLTDPNPAYVSLLGTDVAPGGSLTFSEVGTTTPKATYSDYELATENENPLTLDASGRAETEVWLDGAYTVVLKDADGTQIWERDVRPEVAPGLALPDPVGNDGQVVVASGTGYILQEKLELPDPTDSASYMPVVNADGTGYILQPQPELPEPPDPEVVVSTDKFQAGTSESTTKWLEQKGTDSAPASGGKTTTKSVVFATAFAATPVVVAVPTSANSCATANIIPSVAVTSISTTGFTFVASTVTGGTSADSYTGSNITGAVPFAWFAAGTVTVTP